jgi:hypothetical protein
MPFGTPALFQPPRVLPSVFTTPESSQVDQGEASLTVPPTTSVREPLEHLVALKLVMAVPAVRCQLVQVDRLI